MRYHHERPINYESPIHARSYRCDHPVYSRGTLYFDGGVGFVIIQQRYDPSSKRTWWNDIDPWLVESVYACKGFPTFFKNNAEPAVNGIFPTFTIRQVMWALRMKPLKKESWETVFDHKPI